MSNLSKQEKLRLLAVKSVVVERFNSGHWSDIGLMTDCDSIINGHGRLLRSLSFGDDDYSGNVAEVLLEIAEADPANLRTLEEYVEQKFGETGIHISSVSGGRKITFTPSVFRMPEVEVRRDLVSVMMPFAGFDAALAAIKGACEDAGMECARVDDIWKDTVIVNDVFRLIYESQVVICDLTNRNPNVFYELGIAHTLGKNVIPIARNIDDVPSDLRHHRTLIYLNNGEGLRDMRRALAHRLCELSSELQ